MFFLQNQKLHTWHNIHFLCSTSAEGCDYFSYHGMLFICLDGQEYWDEGTGFLVDVVTRYALCNVVHFPLKDLQKIQCLTLFLNRPISYRLYSYKKSQVTNSLPQRNIFPLLLKFYDNIPLHLVAHKLDVVDDLKKKE